MAELDSAGDSSPALLPSSGKFERRASIPSALAPVHVQVCFRSSQWLASCTYRRQVHELGLDGASEGVSVSSARALATSGHRRGSTALLVGDVAFIVDLRACSLMPIVFAFGLTEFSQMPHMKTSLPEIIDPKVIVFVISALYGCFSRRRVPQAVNEQVQCAQRTEKGLSGYVFNKQTGLVNKVCFAAAVGLRVARCISPVVAVLEKALVRACGLSIVVVHPSTIGSSTV